MANIVKFSVRPRTSNKQVPGNLDSEAWNAALTEAAYLLLISDEKLSNEQLSKRIEKLRR